MVKKYKEEYTISFYKDCPNWASLSSIDKKTFYSFIKYLYSLERKIVVLPYICGGQVGPCHADPTLDRTKDVSAIVEEIKNKTPIHEMLTHHFSCNNTRNNKFLYIHFNEDLFEFFKSIGLDNNNALKQADYCSSIFCDVDEVKYRLENINGINHSKAKSFIRWFKTKPKIHGSRWKFVYMFRNEFKKFMDEKGYFVNPIGGWVLNDKDREFELGLIDEDGLLY